MKIDSRFLGILTALFVIAILISAVSAANVMDNEYFTINIPDNSDFSQDATTNINAGDVAMNMLVFENTGNSSDDVGTIMYLKDSSDDSNVISDLYNDLKKDGQIVEEKDRYIVFKTQNSTNLLNLNVANDFDSFMSFAESIFSSDVDMSFSSNGNSVSFSDKGLEVADENGQNVSISTDGVLISGQASSDGENVTVDDVDVQSGDYVVYIKNQNNDQVIVIYGNNMEVMKEMADSASFKE